MDLCQSPSGTSGGMFRRFSSVEMGGPARHRRGSEAAWIGLIRSRRWATLAESENSAACLRARASKARSDSSGRRAQVTRHGQAHRGLRDIGMGGAFWHGRAGPRLLPAPGGSRATLPAEPSGLGSFRAGPRKGYVGQCAGAVQSVSVSKMGPFSGVIVALNPQDCAPFRPSVDFQGADLAESARSSVNTLNRPSRAASALAGSEADSLAVLSGNVNSDVV